MTISESLTEEALILRLRSTEHDFVERKPRAPQRDWLQAAVASANSSPIGWPAVLFVGVDDNGNPQQGTEKLEDLSKSVSAILDQAYPAIYRHIVPLHLPDGGCFRSGDSRQPGASTLRGKSYIRDGPQTKEAPAKQFAALIAERTSLIFELRRKIGEPVLCRVVKRGYSNPEAPFLGDILECTQHYIAIKGHGTTPPIKSFPLTKVSMSFDLQRQPSCFGHSGVVNKLSRPTRCHGVATFVGSPLGTL